MKLFASLLFIISCLTLTLSQDVCLNLEEKSSSNIWEERLIRDIMCGYNRRKPPIDAKGTVEITLNMKVKSFTFDSDRQTFTLFTENIFFWEDTRLEWNASAYGDIFETVAVGYKIWIPDIKLLNNFGDFSDGNTLAGIDCRVFKYGIVACISKFVYEVKCGSDIRIWPYDVSKCTLSLGVKSVDGANISIPEDRMSINFETSQSGWDIVECKHKSIYSGNKTFDRVELLFHLTRHGEVFASIIVYPSIILSLVTVLSLFLDVRNNLRLSMVVFSLLCHFYFLTEIGQQVPRGVNSVPKILIYFRGTLVMTFMSTAMTLLFSFLCARKSVPKWAVSVNRNIAACFLKFVVIWKTKSVNEWTDLVNFVNNIWIFLCMSVNVIFYFVLIPKSSGLAPVPANDFIEELTKALNNELN